MSNSNHALWRPSQPDDDRAWIFAGAEVATYNPTFEVPYVRLGRIGRVTERNVYTIDGQRYIKDSKTRLGGLAQKGAAKNRKRRYELLPVGHPAVIEALALRASTIKQTAQEEQ